MNKRRRLTGTVKSNKMDKTVIVEVTRTFQHPLYHKVVRSVKAYKAHDEIGCNVGDKVVIVESAPISKTVTWVVENIVKVEIRQESVEAVEEAIEQAEELAAEEAAIVLKTRSKKKLKRSLKSWKMKKVLHDSTGISFSCC